MTKKYFGIFDRSDHRVIDGILLEEDADKLVDLMNKGRDDQDFYNEEEEWDGTVAVISFDEAKTEWSQKGNYDS